MERWQAEMDEKRLGVVEAKDEDRRWTLPPKFSGARSLSGQNHGEQGRPRAKWINKSPDRSRG